MKHEESSHCKTKLTCKIYCCENGRMQHLSVSGNISFDWIRIVRL
jgi:hypothetical protein